MNLPSWVPSWVTRDCLAVIRTFRITASAGQNARSICGYQMMPSHRVGWRTKRFAALQRLLVNNYVRRDVDGGYWLTEKGKELLRAVRW